VAKCGPWSQLCKRAAGFVASCIRFVVASFLLGTADGGKVYQFTIADCGLRIENTEVIHWQAVAQHSLPVSCRGQNGARSDWFADPRHPMPSLKNHPFLVAVATVGYAVADRSTEPFNCGLRIADCGMRIAE